MARATQTRQAKEEPAGASEPVWLVRVVVVLFFIGFAAFLAREMRWALDALP